MGRRTSWERRTEWPLIVVAMVFLAAYAWPILDPRLPSGLRRLCDLVVLGAWVSFAVDYAVRLLLSADRRAFLRTHALDLLTIVLPVLRPLRLLRLVVLIRVLNRRATASLHGRVVAYVATSAVLGIFVAALAELDAERGHADASIDDFGDALWWAATTVTTVGYGDRFPVTATGRWIAVGLMLSGIALLGAVTAAIASWLIAQVREVEQDTETVLHQEVAGLRADIANLRAAMISRTAAPEPPSSP